MCRSTQRGSNLVYQQPTYLLSSSCLLCVIARSGARRLDAIFNQIRKAESVQVRISIAYYKRRTPKQPLCKSVIDASLNLGCVGGDKLLNPWDKYLAHTGNGSVNFGSWYVLNRPLLTGGVSTNWWVGTALKITPCGWTSARKRSSHRCLPEGYNCPFRSMTMYAFFLSKDCCS